MCACEFVICQILRSMMEAQDQLERKYISKKDEHRALEMQNYMGLSRNTGTFDPNRLKKDPTIALMWMCQSHVYAFIHVFACVCVCVQAGGGRHIQDRDAPWGYKGDDRQNHVRSDLPTPLFLHSHTHDRVAVCETQSARHAHSLTIITAWGNQLTNTSINSPILNHFLFSRDFCLSSQFHLFSSIWMSHSVSW